jgi:hypothetical protein
MSSHVSQRSRSLVLPLMGIQNRPRMIHCLCLIRWLEVADQIRSLRTRAFLHARAATPEPATTLLLNGVAFAGLQRIARTEMPSEQALWTRRH